MKHRLAFDLEELHDLVDREELSVVFSHESPPLCGSGGGEIVTGVTTIIRPSPGSTWRMTGL